MGSEAGCRHFFWTTFARKCDPNKEPMEDWRPRLRPFARTCDLRKVNCGAEYTCPKLQGCVPEQHLTAVFDTSAHTHHVASALPVIPPILHALCVESVSLRHMWTVAAST